MRAPVVAAIVALWAAAPAPAQRQIPADRYLDQLRGMWLGQILGNYAGRPTEGKYAVGYPRGNPAEDVDWSFVPATTAWDGDDDTCFEYMYAALLAGQTDPNAADLKRAWERHVPLPSFYIANRQARWLLAEGLSPPDTGSLRWNMHWYAIDSQITTESLGAAAPGLRQRATELAGLCGSVTNDGYAAHAARFYAAMYAAAACLSDVEQLVEQGLAVLPADTSRTAQVVRDVRDWYLADKADGSLDWRQTHQQLYDKYVSGPAAKGRYRSWIESTVNAGLTTLAILYGRGDFKDTVRIAVLGGFDSDCNPATAGGLIGLILGYSGLPADLTSDATDSYRVTALRDIPADTTVSQVAALWQAAAERQILAAGGSIVTTEAGRVYCLPEEPPVVPPPERPDPPGPGGLVGQVLAAGGTVTASASVARYNGDNDRENLKAIFDGITDLSYNGRLPYWTSDGIVPQPPGGDFYQLDFGRTVTFRRLVFHEGDILWDSPNANPREQTPRGGYFLDLTVEVGSGGLFEQVANLTLSEPLDPFQFFQRIELTFDAAMGDAVRIRGQAGGTQEFTTIVELEAFGRMAGMGDADEDGDVDFIDFLTTRANFGLSPADWPNGDFDLDGDVDFFDYLTVKANFGSLYGGSWLPVGAPQAPAPGALCLLALAAARLLPKRRGR